MNKKNIQKASNGFFFLAILFGAYAIINTMMNFITLPPGVCPVANYRNYIIIALIFTIVSMLLSWIGGREKEE